MNSINELFLNKIITWKKKTWEIVEVSEWDGIPRFKLKLVKGKEDGSTYFITVYHFANGDAKIDNPESIAYSKQVVNDHEEAKQIKVREQLKQSLHLKEIEQREEKEREARWEREEQEKKAEKENNKKIRRQENLVRKRISGALEDEYPGDLQELLKWMRENATQLVVLCGPKVGEREQSALDYINAVSGTNYQVTYVDSVYPFPVYKLHFKNINKAPKEFKKWFIPKHSNETMDITVWEDKPALDRKGWLASNRIVKDLIFNPTYNFKVK